MGFPLGLSSCGRVCTHSPLNLSCPAGFTIVPVKPWHCQAALALTQTAFCVGSVYLKSSLRQVSSSAGLFLRVLHGQHNTGRRQRRSHFLGIDLDALACLQVASANGHAFHPIIYAFLREATAGFIMCAGATFFTGSLLPYSKGCACHMRV